MNEEDQIEEYIFNTDEAMDAVYEVLIDGECIAEVLSKSKYLVVFPFDPTLFTSEDIDDMLEHYVEREEYEKCAVLRDYYKNKGHEKNNN
jgi:hypothetical protein|tara:strand:- start:138 stop:407 length:270 start_codon:yes stop_codon:yes gene_type:complete